MPFSVLPALCLTLVQAAPGDGGAVRNQTNTLAQLEILGGDESDQLFARHAVGTKPGAPFGAKELEEALAAVKATDRFRKVNGSLVPGTKGQTLHLELEPWPALASVEFRGTSPLPIHRGLFPDLRKGVRPGTLRLQRWMAQATQKLQLVGYPKAQVRYRLEQGDTRMVVEVQPGAPARIQACQIDGNLREYPQARLLKLVGIVPGQTLWSQELERRIVKVLRKRLVKDHHLESRIDSFHWEEENGHFAFRVHVGPTVRVNYRGEWHYITWESRSSFNPLLKAIQFNPELWDEGDRAFLRYLRGLGYLDARVSHQREVKVGDDGKAEQVEVTYEIHPGKPVYIGQLRFQTTADIPEETLRKVADLPSGRFWIGEPPAKPDTLSDVEDRLKDYFLGLGYPDVSVRRLPLERKGQEAVLGFQIQEHQKQTLASLDLELPDTPDWNPWIFADCLGLVMADRPMLSGPANGPLRQMKGDRRGLEAHRAVIQCSRDAARPGLQILSLKADPVLPLVRNDLALVLASVRNRMNSLGIQRPTPKIQVEGDEAVVARIEVLDQPRTLVNRVVVQGSDRTQGRAVFREVQLEPGAPLAGDQINKAQANLGNLNVFRTLDVRSLAEDASDPQGPTWKDGDLLFQAQERAPWVVTSSLGYDKSQGYHVGTGIERLNLGGMGRTMDLGIRAGDATINNPTLRRLFHMDPEDYTRSVDMFSLGYTDPKFTPGSLEGLLPDRTRMRLEGAYIEEHQDIYLLRRRRFTSDLQWRAFDVDFTLGYRFERADVRPSVDSVSDADLALISRNPGRSIVSAPYLQVQRDGRDNALDPTQGSLGTVRLDTSLIALGASTNSSFAKLEARQQWFWPLGFRASAGVVSFGIRLGAAYTLNQGSQNLPLSERFFAGGPTTHRGVEPDTLGPFDYIVTRETTHPYAPKVPTTWKSVPLGGQAMVLSSLEYRFPLMGQYIWGEIFADSGQVYQYFNNAGPTDTSSTADPQPPPKEGRDLSAHPPFLTALGLGLISKIGGIPIKLEYAADVRRIFGMPRTQHERDTQLSGILISAGYQF